MMTNCATLSWRLMPRIHFRAVELPKSAGFFGSLGRVAAPKSAAHMLIAVSARNSDINLHFTAKSLAYAPGSVTLSALLSVLALLPFSGGRLRRRRLLRWRRLFAQQPIDGTDELGHLVRTLLQDNVGPGVGFIQAQRIGEA